MIRWSAVALMACSIVHVLVLGVDLPGEFPDWLRLELWTFDHWQPLRTQPVDLALSGGVFWATVGSFAVPNFILGALILWADRNALPLPPFVGWAMFAWTLLASAIMLPSGFPVAALITLCLAIGLQRQARAGS